MSEETYTVEVLLTEEAFSEARRMGQAPDYVGPTFKEAKMVRCDEGVITVNNKDGSFYVFPISRIARVKGKENV